MARQITYGEDREVHAGDQWLITDQADGGTKNLTVSTLAKYFAQSGVADPNRIGFHYTHTSAGSVTTGEFRYVYDSINLAPGTVTKIQLHRYSSRGVDFQPIYRIIEGIDIKITDITDSTNTNYAIYSAGGATLVGDIIEVNLTLRAAAGPLPQGETVLTTLGSFDNSFTGGRILEGADDPNGLVAGQEGDVYFHVRTADQELDVYGPLPVANVAPGYDWGTPIQLNGEAGEAINAVSSVAVAGGVDLTFYVNTPDPSNPTTGAILQTVFVPEGPQGPQGEGIINADVTGGMLTFTGSTGYTGATGPFDVMGDQGPVNGIMSFGSVTDPVTTPPLPAGMYTQVVFDSGDTIYIPEATDGDHGQGVNAIQLEPIAGTVPLQQRLEVQYVTDGVIDVNFTPIGIITNGSDGSNGTNGTGVNVALTTNTPTDYRLTFTPIAADGSSGTPIPTPNLIGPAGPTLQVEGGLVTTLTNATSIDFAGTAVTSLIEGTPGTGDFTVTIDQDNDIPTNPTLAGQVLTATGTTDGAWGWSPVPADTITVQDETVDINGADTITTLNFTGGVAVTAGAAGVVNIDITGGGTPVAMTPEITHSGAQQREVGETFSILLSGEHVDTFVITPPVNADLTNGWMQTNSTDSNGNVTVIISPDDLTGVDSSVLTVNGTYTLAGNPDVFNFATVEIPLSTFFGWHYGQVSVDVDLPPETASSITVDEFFSDGGPGTLGTNLPDDDQGHFNSPEDLEGELTNGQWLYFAFPGMNEYKFYNEGRRLRNLTTRVSNDGTNTFRYYKMNVGDDFEITITT